MKHLLFLLLPLLLLYPGDLQKIPQVRLKELGTAKMYDSQTMLGKKVTIITFWATWCMPCMQELAHLQQIKNKYGAENVTVVAISTDDAKSMAKVKPYIYSKKYDFLVLMDPNTEAMRRFNIQSIPQTYVVNSEGGIFYSQSGYSPGDELKVEEIIKKQLGITGE